MSRKVVVVLACVLALSLALWAKDKSKSNSGSSNDQQKAYFLNIEKQLWDAYKNKDTTTFDKYVPPNGVELTGEGLHSRDQIMQSANNCQITSQGIDEGSAQLVKVSNDTMIMYYRAKVDGTCNGQKVPSDWWASTVWVNKGGKWEPQFHQETPAMESQSAQQQPPK